MIRSLQRRFVLTAMASLIVLLVILLGGTLVVSYFTMESSTDQVLDLLALGGEGAAPGSSERQPMFGYQIDPNPLLVRHAVVVADAGGKVLTIEAGFLSEENEATFYRYALEVLEGDSTQGKLSSYKYRVTALGEAGYRIVFLDVSPQAQMLWQTVKVACSIALICAALMLLILLLVSRPAVRPIAENIEKQRRFVTDAGHEIKTPLAIIQANVDAMDLHLGGNKWSKHIRAQTTRLDGLMGQLLSLSKMEESSMEMDFEDVLFHQLVSECVAAFSALDAQKEIASNIAPHVRIRGNPESLAQLCSILLDNAIKYADEDGVIFVKLTQMGKKAVLEVTNTCASLPQAAPETLFDRFYRADTARTQKSGGYGIGLSIAQTITEKHKGKIAAFYDDGHTIRFRVEL